MGRGKKAPEKDNSVTVGSEGALAQCITVIVMAEQCLLQWAGIYNQMTAGKTAPYPLAMALTCLGISSLRIVR